MNLLKKKITGLPEDFSVQLDSIYQDILSQVLSYFQPQTVNYPVELLMDQHHYLAIFLFILILLLSIFIFILAYMAVLIIFKDKILSFITNKYLLLYLKMRYKLMYAEILFLSMLILYDFYYIITISHFLCLHPIDVNINK